MSAPTTPTPDRTACVAALEALRTGRVVPARLNPAYLAERRINMAAHPSAFLHGLPGASKSLLGTDGTETRKDVTA